MNTYLLIAASLFVSLSATEQELTIQKNVSVFSLAQAGCLVTTTASIIMGFYLHSFKKKLNDKEDAYQNLLKENNDLTSLNNSTKKEIKKLTDELKTLKSDIPVAMAMQQKTITDLSANITSLLDHQKHQLDEIKVAHEKTVEAHIKAALESVNSAMASELISLKNSRATISVEKELLEKRLEETGSKYEKAANLCQKLNTQNTANTELLKKACRHLKSAAIKQELLHADTLVTTHWALQTIYATLKQKPQSQWCERDQLVVKELVRAHDLLLALNKKHPENIKRLKVKA